MESLATCHPVHCDDDILKIMNNLHLSNSEHSGNVEHSNLSSTPKKAASVENSEPPLEERDSSIFQSNIVIDNPTEVEICPGACACRTKARTMEDECNIDFRSRTNSGYGSFSNHPHCNSPNKFHHRLPDNMQHATDTINQRTFEVPHANCFADQTTGTKDILPRLFHNGPANSIGFTEHFVYMEHSDIVLISPETFTIQDSTSMSPSSKVLPVPNEYQSVAKAHEDDEINEPNTYVSQNTGRQNLGEIEQYDLVSKMEGKDRMCLIVYVKNADCVIVGNNTTVNQNTLKLKGLLNNNNVTLTIAPEVLSRIIKNDIKNVPGALRRAGSIGGKRYIHIMECMKKYQDSGRTQELERFAEAMVNKLKKDEIDLKIVILLERALYFIYHNNLKDAKLTIDEAIRMATSAQNASFLLGRCHNFLALILFNEKKYTETLECLENASTFMENFVSGEDKGFCCDLYGHTYLKMAGEVAEPCPDFEAKALAYFQMAIHHAREDPELRVRNQRMHYCLFRQISNYLRTYSEQSKQLPVGEKEIKQAKYLLDHFDEQYWDDAPPGTRVNYFVCKSDYYFRKKSFKRAIGILKGEGMEIARSVGHKSLLEIVVDRIKYLTPFEENMEEASAPYVSNDIERFDEIND